MPPSAPAHDDGHDGDLGRVGEGGHAARKVGGAAEERNEQVGRGRARVGEDGEDLSRADALEDLAQCAATAFEDVHAVAGAQPVEQVVHHRVALAPGDAEDRQAGEVAAGAREIPVAHVRERHHEPASAGARHQFAQRGHGCGQFGDHLLHLREGELADADHLDGVERRVAEGRPADPRDVDGAERFAEDEAHASRGLAAPARGQRVDDRRDAAGDGQGATVRERDEQRAQPPDRPVFQTVAEPAPCDHAFLRHSVSRS